MAPSPAGSPGAQLVAAIRGDDVQLAERALSEGASVDSTGDVEKEPKVSAGVVTALMLAVKLGRNRIAKLLLERGADVHARRPGTCEWPHNRTTAVYMAALFKKMTSKEAAEAAFRKMDKNGDRALEVSEPCMTAICIYDAAFDDNR